MRPLLPLLLSFLLLIAVPASACVDGELAFEPSTAVVGQWVTLSGSLLNTGPASIEADIALVLRFGEISYGPVTGTLILGPGETLGVSFPFPVPPFLSGGDLVLEATASSEGCLDVATATLTVGGAASSVSASDLAPIAEQMIDELTTGAAVGLAETTFGAVKSRF